ncbi:helix-turn-helix domain-containing protein [Silvibacterium acidisoli]|uniref:helix-turn-helix domain-containing protein n=1 Tax=Acidobacteriaceae bacterium ZG23-2 TaxID=2883246 RepID=UPI00406BEF56
MAVHDGEWKPLFASEIEGSFSPSPSLRVERHRIEPVIWSRVLIPKQIVILALDTHEVLHKCNLGSVSTTLRHEGTVSVEKRDHEQSICWRSPATTLTVELDDAVLAEVQTADTECNTEDDRVQALSPLLYALEAERQQGYPHGQLFVDGIEQAIACIVVAITGHAQVRRSTQVPSMAPHQLRRVNEYVKAHLDKKIILRDMAREAGLSTSHFSRLFRKSSGRTPHQYVLEQRIDHAKSLMADSHHSLLDIAIASGFRTHQHFSKVFHRITGRSPRQYRSQI